MLLPVPARSQAAATRETLHNGIVLPSPWPPRLESFSDMPQRPPYLAAPPDVIDITIGRQLFVDDFLIAESGLYREFHAAAYATAGPVLTPERDWERLDPHAELTGDPPSPTAMVFSDGVFFDPADRLFKMWYMAGYQHATALATSSNGTSWERPSLDVVRGTNIVSAQPRDSSTVWLDLEEPDATTRFKMAGYDLRAKALRLHVSSDGVHWRPIGMKGPFADRSTFFRNPFRKRWVYSLRADDEGGLYRFRRYLESDVFAAGGWPSPAGVVWAAADRADPPREDIGDAPQLYCLDCVAYESLFLGLFTMYRGEQPNREKPNDICLGFSRDGFHWARLSRAPFIGVSEREGDWNWANVQSAGGGCLVVGDELFFYVSGRQGVPGTSLPGVCSTGLATLRRDGFASVTDRWPEGIARRVTESAATLTTRPLRFSGRHLFVNAEVEGELFVEVLDRRGQAIERFSRARARPVTGSGTRLAVEWEGTQTLDAVAGDPVRLRFTLSRARLYSFWVSETPDGASGGYLAAGGPGYSGAIDA